MKKALTLLSIVLLLASLASAQSGKEPEYLLISVLTEAGGLAGMHEKVIVTKQDGSQEVIKDHSLRTVAFASKGINIVEDSLMQMLQPSFEAGRIRMRPLSSLKLLKQKKRHNFDTRGVKKPCKPIVYKTY
jgi:hypothetical protein